MFKTASSFAVALNQWAAFLVWLYERDRVTTHALVGAHSMTAELLEELASATAHHSALTGISGAHLALARVVDAYLSSVEHCASAFQRDVRLLVEGGHTKSYYYRALAPFFRRTPAKITSVVRHNSPWDLGITLAHSSGAVMFFALFLATRTRIELIRITDKLAGKAQHAASATSSNVRPKKRRTAETDSRDRETLLTVDFGGHRPLRATPNLRLRAYLPGNLVAELKLDIASQQIARLRKTVKDLL